MIQPTFQALSIKRSNLKIAKEKIKHFLSYKNIKHYKLSQMIKIRNKV